jgi:hypothetical protein
VIISHHKTKVNILRRKKQNSRAVFFQKDLSETLSFFAKTIGTTGCPLYIYINYTDGTRSDPIQVVGADEQLYVFTSNEGNSVDYLSFSYGIVGTASMRSIQLEPGSTATAYEPYKGQTLTASTPGGLPGIPVTSGGNYTDANGQQWICDEIDFARGVYIKRIEKKVFDGTEEGWWQDGDQRAFKIYWDGVNGGWLENEAMSSHFVCNAAKAYSATSECFAIDNNGLCYFAYDKATLDEFKVWLAANNVTVLCPLTAPIEIPLSEEELAAYDALHTYRDNTTVTNDAGAWMDLEYVMDAKKYIDSMISASGIIPATVE